MSTESSKVKVVVRLRPTLKHEKSGPACVTIQEDGTTVQLQNLKAKVAECYSYRLDSCYDETASQSVLFEQEVKPLLSNLFEGLNITVFAYGVTGAGKTHTMQGSAEEPGVIPRSLEHVIGLAHEYNKNVKPANNKASVCVSYVEIYNEKVYDLLKPGSADLPIREGQAKNIFIHGLAEVTVNSIDDFHKTYALGCSNRTTGATKLNANSSRSHAILLVKVQLREGSRSLIGKLHLIDLAGSEDNRRTENTGVRLLESSNINQSLFVLGKVVNALNKDQNRVPYRDSKLTRLLQDSLGGNSLSVMIANIASGFSFFHDTFNTLNFASKSRLIVNKPVVNMEVETPPQVIIRDANMEDKLSQWKHSKRSGSDDHTTAQRKKVRINESNKENIKGIENIVEKQVEALLEKKLGKNLLSPYFRDYKILDTATQSRLERLERKLLEQTEEGTEQVIDTVLSDDEDSKPKVKYDLMTPCTRVKTAKQLLIRAKELERYGDKAQALIDYHQAASLIPEGEKLGNKIKKKIAQLEQDTAYDAQRATSEHDRSPVVPVVPIDWRLGSDDEDSSSTTTPRSQTSTSKEDSGQYSSKERDILRTLNSGTYDELLALHCIGQSRAKKIMAHRQEHSSIQLQDIQSWFGDKVYKGFYDKNILA